MADDLAGTPRSGIQVQLCGDAHLSNFGVYASPERALLFDVNDFDETLPGPWEWDVKRLAASIVVASRVNGFDDSDCRRAALSATGSYRERMAKFSEMGSSRSGTRALARRKFVVCSPLPGPGGGPRKN
jgi:uncharacterized protein (DUF2252 family)